MLFSRVRRWMGWVTKGTAEQRRRGGERRTAKMSDGRENRRQQESYKERIQCKHNSHYRRQDRSVCVTVASGIGAVAGHGGRILRGYERLQMAVTVVYMSCWWISCPSATWLYALNLSPSVWMLATSLKREREEEDNEGRVMKKVRYWSRVNKARFTSLQDVLVEPKTSSDSSDDTLRSTSTRSKSSRNEKGGARFAFDRLVHLPLYAIHFLGENQYMLFSIACRRAISE